jgi:hypothetical protein
MGSVEGLHRDGFPRSLFATDASGKLIPNLGFSRMEPLTGSNVVRVRLRA